MASYRGIKTPDITSENHEIDRMTPKVRFPHPRGQPYIGQYSEVGGAAGPQVARSLVGFDSP